MRRLFSALCALAGVAVLSCPVAESLAQNLPNSNSPQTAVILTKLSPSAYPPLALRARIAGEVELMLDVRPNGSIASAIVVSGHPLLKQAALESAQQSQFECRNCIEVVRSYRLLYTFQLGPTKYCAETSDAAKSNQQEQPYPRVTQSQDHVTVIDQPEGTCDPVVTITGKKVRSAKCLYLWRCGFLPLTINE